MSNLIPNRFPIYQSPLRIAIIGESPAIDDVHANQPFMGASGRFLAALLSRAGVSREACYLGNITQYQPPANNIHAFSWSGDEIQEGMAQLRTDMASYRPNIVVLLGNFALHAAKCWQLTPPKKLPYPVSKWRGSLFLAPEDGGPFAGLKCLSTYHPAYCLRDYDSVPMLQFDLRKAVREGSSPLLILPKRIFDVDLSFDDLCTKLKWFRAVKKRTAFDIEGYVTGVSCISFSNDSAYALVVPFYRQDGSFCWDDNQSAIIWRLVAELLEDPEVPKVTQNGLYDRFVLHYAMGIRVNGNVDDIMVKHWELYSELEKSLAVQASIYTDEPYWKYQRKEACQGK